MIVVNGNKHYSVNEPVGENNNFRFYRANESDSKDEYMVKIGKTLAENGLLDHEVFILKEMCKQALYLEQAYEKERGEPGDLNYQLGFPLVKDSFVSPEQGDRRIVVLELQASDKLNKLSPLSLIRKREKVRVDPKTSAWILGKSLKIIAFAHDQGILVDNLSADNILIQKDNHLVTIFDWSKANLGKSPDVTTSRSRAEISAVAKEVTLLLSGDLKTGTLPENDQLINNDYADFIASLVRGVYTNAFTAHSAFYEVVESLWGRKFHPYTTLPIQTTGE